MNEKESATHVIWHRKTNIYVKKVIIFASLLFVASSSSAQFYTSFLPSPEFNNALEKIVSDFRYDFKNITADTLNNPGEVESYLSKVMLPGTTECVINKYHSAKDTTAS
jgi:hypothetical protein